MPSSIGAARFRRGGRWRSFALIALVLMALPAALYAAWPWLAAAAAPRLAPVLGLDELRLTVARPGPTGIAVGSLELVAGRFRITASRGHIGYRLPALLRGRLDMAAFQHAVVQVAAPDAAAGGESGGESAAGDDAGTAEPPSVPALFDALPVAELSVETLELRVPELDFRAEGRLRITGEHLEAHLDALAPERAERFHLDLTVSAAGEIQARIGEQAGTDAPVLQVRSSLAGRRVAVAGDLELTGFPLELAAAVAGLPPGRGAVAGTFSATLPRPVAAIADWTALAAEGRLAVHWQPLDGRWAIADGTADWQLARGALTATATGTFTHSGRAVAVTLEAQDVDPGGAHGHGSVEAVQRGDRDSRLALGWELAPEQVTLDGSFELSESVLTWLPADARPPPGRGTLSGRLDAVLPRPLPDEWTDEWPDQWQDAVPAAQGTLAGDWHLRDHPLGVETFEGDWHLDHGRLSGSLHGRITRQDLSAAVQLDLDVLELGGPALAGEGTVALGGLVRVPFSVRHHTGTGAGGLTAEAEVAFDAPLLEHLVQGWGQPYDLVEGAAVAQAELRWSAAQALTGTVDVALDDIDARYQDYRLSGLRGELAFSAAADGAWRLAPADLQATRIDTGVELSAVRTRLAWSGDTVTVDGFSAGLLGGTAGIDTFAYAVQAGEADLVVALTGLDLGRILALEGEHLSGTGTLHGTLPVQVRRNQVSIVAGEVQAEPPGGVIRVSPALAGGTGQPGLDFALRALQDFRYSVLEADVAYTAAGDLTLAVRLQGRNPAIEAGRPIHYNLTVTENVPTLLRSLRLQDDVTRQIERGLTD